MHVSRRRTRRELHGRTEINRVKLSKKDKLAISNLLFAGRILSNIGFNLGQLEGENAPLCKEACRKWDAAYADAKEAIRKLQLPPF